MDPLLSTFIVLIGVTVVAMVIAWIVEGRREAREERERADAALRELRESTYTDDGGAGGDS